jgi:hypothetical protein
MIWRGFEMVTEVGGEVEWFEDNEADRKLNIEESRQVFKDQ